MKLNYKKVIFVGFAFFLITAFWQAYDSIVPMMLVNKFGLNQTLSGVIMALDNVLALVLLPVFGAISDKTKSKYGKRTPYVVIGTIMAIIAFMGLTFCDNMQLNNVYSNANESQFFEMVWEQGDDIKISNKEYTEGQEKEYSLKDYVSRLTKNKPYASLSESEKQEVENSFISLAGDYDKTYTYIDGEYTLVDENAENGKNIYSNIITPCKSAYAWTVTVNNPLPIILFVAVLLITLLSMATFRSPAVALMPDVTIKPLRSKANAIINLMGTAGGILVLVLGMIFGTGKVYNQTMSYTFFVLAVCAIMAVGLILFLLKVREVKWAKEMEEETALLTEQGLIKEEKVEETGEKLSKSKTISLILILASVALWFMGYNAITTKYSLYASNVLHKDYNTTLLIAQAAAIVAYVPVGIIASKIGRKKSILAGVIMLAVAFFSATFVTSQSPEIIITIFFALAGIGWATINVNSFPMVVELAKGSNTGKYTGLYYTASMSAQIITPVLSGAIMDLSGTMTVLFPYATIFVIGSFITMLFVKHGDNKVTEKKSVLEHLDVD